MLGCNKDYQLHFFLLSGHPVTCASARRKYSSMHQNPMIPWIIAALVAVVSLMLLFRVAPMSVGSTTTPLVLDVALIFATVLTLVLLSDTAQFSRALLAPHRVDEGFTQNSTIQPPLIEEDGAWAQSLATKSALVTYVSGFCSDSYPGTRGFTNVWQSVADKIMGTDGGEGSDDNVYKASAADAAAAAASVSGIQCQVNGATTSMDFSFNAVQPLWKSGVGFALANSILTGPLSMDIFPQTRAFTVFCLFQLSGLPANNTTATLISIPANGSPKQNGARLDLRAMGTPSGSSVKASVDLIIGNQAAQKCSDNGSDSVTFDTNARYLLCITRSSVNVRVSLFHVESSSAQCLPVILLNATIDDDALVYNNQAIVVNGNGADAGGGVIGNIMTFGIFNQALVAKDEALICSHYHDMLLLQDPLVQQAQSTAAAASAAMACPYDSATCNACASVSSWANPYHVANGGAACMAAIDSFCRDNPTHTGCECYDPAKIAKFSVSALKTCQAIKSAYSGNTTALCAGPVKVALAAAESKRKAIAEALEISNHQLHLQEEQQRRERDLERRENQQLASCMDSNHKYGQYDDVRKCYPCIVCGQCTAAAKKAPSFFAWLFGL